MNIKKLHAEHNKEVCDFLRLKADIKCNDWIVTTAFYSVLHLIEYKIFPIQVGENSKINNILEAQRFFKTNSKHEARETIVNKYLTNIKEDYKFLSDECRNARYVNYDINDSVANLCYKKLESIFKYLNK